MLLKRHVRTKGDPLVDRVELLEANQTYAHVRFPGGREDTVSVKDLSPDATDLDVGPEVGSEVPSNIGTNGSIIEHEVDVNDSTTLQEVPLQRGTTDRSDDGNSVNEEVLLRRSSRNRKEPDRLTY